MSLNQKIIAIMQKGVGFFNENKYKESIENFEYVINSNRGLPDGYYWLYKNHYATGDIKTAKKYFEDALKFLHITSSFDENQKEIFHKWLDEYKKIFKSSYLLQIVETNPECEKKIERLKIDAKDKQALKTIKNCKNISKNILHLKYDILRKLNLVEIIDIFGYILNDLQENRDLLIDIGDVLFDSQYYYLSASVYQGALKRFGECYKAYYKLAVMTNNVNGNLELAKKYLKKSIEIKDDYLNARLMLLSIYEQLGEMFLIEDELKSIITKHPEINICEHIVDFFIRINLGKCSSLFDGLKSKDLYALSAFVELQLVYNKTEQISQTMKDISSKVLNLKPSNVKDNKLKKLLNQYNNVVAFYSTGRSGSYFVHSLFDGHKEIATIPGAFLKGFFGLNVFGMFLSNSKKDFIKRFMNIYESMFDATSLKSIPGDPMGGKGSISLAKVCGLTTLGENRDINLQIDKEKFERLLLKYLNSMDNINEKELFILIHIVWEEVKGHNIKEKKVIFYHIHNPSIVEFTRFNLLFEDSKQLFMVRNYLQSLESWMHTALPNKTLEGIESKVRLSLFYRVYKSMLGKIYTRIFGHRGITYMAKDVNVLRLEDVKNTPEDTMKEVASWMGIEYDDSLVKPEFMGHKFNSNSSKLNPKISGFDKASIKRKIGILFSHNDAVLLNTVLRPWNETFEYNEGEFKYVSIEEALKMNDSIMDWEKKLIDFFGINEEDALKSIKYRKQKLALALNTQEQVFEELKKVELIKPEGIHE